jgi:shikimate dehydrogenase
VRRGAHVVVVNRTVERASELVAAVSALGAGGTIRVGTEADVEGASILVNATSVGMNSSEMPISASHLHSGLVVLDAVYSPMETALLAAARGTGATVVDGLWMLIQQARHQQMLWFGENPSADSMRVAAEQELSRRHK